MFRYFVMVSGPLKSTKNDSGIILVIQNHLSLVNDLPNLPNSDHVLIIFFCLFKDDR